MPHIDFKEYNLNDQYEQSLQLLESDHYLTKTTH